VAEQRCAGDRSQEGRYDSKYDNNGRYEGSARVVKETKQIFIYSRSKKRGGIKTPKGKGRKTPNLKACIPTKVT
jgi:hypothetical protein